jgi:hypothetical protein
VIALLLALAAGPPVEASLLDGRRIAGELVEASPTKFIVKVDDRTTSVSGDDLLRLNFIGASPVKSPMRIRLTDGSRFGAHSFEADGRSAKAMGTFGSISFPVEHLAAVLLVDDRQEAADFIARSSEKPRSDRIVIAREGKRLVLEGIIGKIGADKIEFTLDGDVLPINRSRTKALYFSQKNSPKTPVAVVAERNGDQWAAAEWRWQSGVALKSPSGFERTIAVASLASIDLAIGRVVYLSDLEPALMQHTPGLDHPWPMKRDRGPFGGGLELDGRTFAKGLVLHSRTVVEYNLGGEYRRFQAVVGIPPAAGPAGDAEVKIAADGKVLWKQRIRAGDKPHQLAFDLSGAESLKLEVDFGRNLDLGDHVAFADAKVLK